MRPIGLDDILGRERYGQARDAVRRRVIEHKRARRLALGDRVSLVFEDRATVWYQTQEMLWVERVVDLDVIREELATYNQLLPTPEALAATLLIELTEPARLRDDLRRMIGLDRHLRLEVGDDRIPAVFEDGRQTGERISAVQYVRFPIAAAVRQNLADERTPVAVVADHPQYGARTPLEGPVRASVIGTFLDPARADAALASVRNGIT